MALLLLTRPLASSQRFAELLRSRFEALTIVISPLMAIEPLAVAPLGPDEIAIFTSQHGVEQSAAGQGRIAYTVGAATAQAAQAKGYQVRVGGGDASALIRRILADVPEVTLVHIHGEHTRGAVAQLLQENGLKVREVFAYRQVAQPLDATAKAALSGQKPVIVPLFSPRSAELFLREAPFSAPICYVAISANVAQILAAQTYKQLEIAAKPDASSVCDAIERLLVADLRLEGAKRRR